MLHSTLSLYYLFFFDTLLLLYVYVVSVTIFQTFPCQDVGSDEKEEYMVADYSVNCASSRYAFAFWWAVAMVFVYPLGECDECGVVVMTDVVSSIICCIMRYA